MRVQVAPPVMESVAASLTPVGEQAWLARVLRHSHSNRFFFTFLSASLSWSPTIDEALLASPSSVAQRQGAFGAVRARRPRDENPGPEGGRRHSP